MAVSAADPQPADLSTFAGLILSGGGDVEPERYGESIRHEKTYGCRAARDEMELAWIDRFIEQGKPIVGICRGLQILTVYFGGTLHQHVPDILAEDSERHRNPSGYDCFHAMLADGATQLGHMLRGVPEVNSAHHQAMNEAFPAGPLRIAARSAHGVVEAVECFAFAAPIIAVQWHPERLPAEHPASTRLLDLLRGVCGGA